MERVPILKIGPTLFVSIQIDLQDEIARETLVTQAGEIVNARVREFYSLPSRVAAK